MAYSLWDATVVVAKGALTSLQHVVSEAEKQPNCTDLLAARLSPDMNPLAFQVHYATFSASALAARLCGREPPLPTAEAEPSTYAEAYARIQRALDALGICEQEQVNAIGETMTTYPRPDGEVEVPVKVVAAQVIMPNVYFHTAMAYAVLRKEGVPLGKRHWSRGFVGEYL